MPDNNRLYDVIVVGAGPGGSAVSISLAQAGYSVLLLEKAAFPRDKVCGDFISPRSIRVLRELNCLEAVQAASPNRITQAAMYINGEPITIGTIPQVEGLTSFGYTLPRYQFDEILFRQAQQNRVITLENCRVKSLTTEEDHATVQAVLDGEIVTFRGKMVVAADGANSTLARHCGKENRSSKARIVALRAYFENIHGSSNQAEIYFDSEYFPGYAWIFPLGNGMANVGLGMVQDVYKTYDINLRQQFNIWLERDAHARQRLSGGRLAGRVVGWPLTTFLSSTRNYGERILFIGDAGSFIDPINGEGIHTALESARIAARVADEALQAGDTSAQFLKTYETRWRQAFELDLRSSDFIVTIIKNRSLLGIWLLVLRMIGIRAHNDPHYAERTGGILAGVVPTHTAFSADIILRTLLQRPDFWQENLPITLNNGLVGLLSSGLQTTSLTLDAVNKMFQSPGQTLEWSVDVATKGLGVLNGLVGNLLQSRTVKGATRGGYDGDQEE